MLLINKFNIKQLVNNYSNIFIKIAKIVNIKIIRIEALEY